MWKICSKCKKHLPLWMFDRAKKEAFGVRPNCKVCCAQYRAKNKEHGNRISTEWRINNRWRHNRNNGKLRALVYGPQPELDKKEQQRVDRLYKWGDKLPGRWTVDHIVPLDKGGLHHPDNLHLIPEQENLHKKNKNPEDYYGRWYDFIIRGNECEDG